MTLYRTKSLNNLPDKKIEDKRNNILSSNEDSNIKRLKSDLINRYFDSNIPLEYWNLKMESDFNGDPNLLNFYNHYISDFKKSYNEGKGYVLAGSHGLGKQLCLETLIPTPQGFVSLKDLKEKDIVFDENGKKCNVIKLHPINISPESYEIIFDDDSKVKACKDHLWKVFVNDEAFVLSTGQMVSFLESSNVLKIQVCKMVDFSEHITDEEAFIQGQTCISKNNIVCIQQISNKNKEGRVAFYDGLVQSPLCIKDKNCYKLFIENILFKDEVKSFLCSLGLKVLEEKVSDFFVLNFCDLYELNSKNSKEFRWIKSISKINSVSMRCITVDSPSHLFLITKSFIPTHNTMTGTCILKKFVEKGYTTLYTTLSDIVNVLTLGPNEDKFYARKELVGVDVLFIDEWDNRFMANETASDLYARVLESIIRTRAQNNMPTLFATNSPNIVEAFSGNLKNSLSSLKNGYMIQVPVFGEDFRGKK